jgi:hypothetical protein
MVALPLAVNADHGVLSRRAQAEAALFELTLLPRLANAEVWPMHCITH